MGAARKWEILFVDDDQRILDGLASSLWRLRRSWDMTFACGGEAAIALLDTRRFDAIVTDMRMPLVDGEAVLASFAERSPCTVRVILSGQTEGDVLCRTTTIAHQFLAKPCPVAELRQCLDDMLVVATSMEERARALVVSIGKLPISARTVARLDALLESGADRAELVRCIETDVGLTAKLLHIASAGFVSQRNQAGDVDGALASIGTQHLRAYLATMDSREPTPDMQWLLEHAHATGRLLERHAGDPRAFLCGVLHGLGKLVLGQAFGARYHDMLAAAERDPLTHLSDLEAREFGISHDAIAAHLVKLWNLSPSIADVLHHHCHPRGSDEDLTIALHVACVMSDGRTCLDHDLMDADPRLARWHDRLR